MDRKVVDGKFLGNRQYTITQLVSDLREVVYQVDYRATRNGNLYGPVNRLKSDGVVIVDAGSDYSYKGFASLDSAMKAIEKHARKPYTWQPKSAA